MVNLCWLDTRRLTRHQRLELIFLYGPGNLVIEAMTKHLATQHSLASMIFPVLVSHMYRLAVNTTSRRIISLALSIF